MLARTISILAAFGLLLARTTVAQATDYDIDFGVTNAAAYAVVQFKVHYTSAPGEFSGSGGTVACTANTGLGALAAFNEASPYLYAGLIATSDFTGPVRLATCVFSSTGGAPTSPQFTITIDSWEAGHGTPPTVGITRIALH